MMNNQFKFSVHAVIGNEAGQILQLKATYGNFGWGLPGGMVDPAETVHEALFRECLEEIGVEVTILYLSGLYYHSAYNSQVGIFRCEIPQNSKIVLSDEHSEYRYFSLEELTPVQRHRVNDCLYFDGNVKSFKF